MNSLKTQPLDSRQLRAFATLARTGSFTMAAKELFLSQSAVSHSMKALESEVGCRLLDRMGKKVILTQAGEHLLVHTEKILIEMTQARASLKKLGKWGRTRLRIGASATTCQYILPAIMEEFKRSYSDCMISIESEDTELSVERTGNNQVDFAITLKPRPDEDIIFVPLFTDELVFLVGPTHPWAAGSRIPRTDIPRQNYVLYRKSSYTSQLIEDYFHRDNMVLNTVIQLGSMEAIKEMVKLGMGVSILAPWIARQELRDKELIQLPLGPRKLRREWGMVYRRTKPLSMVEQAFLDLCKERTRDWS